MDQLEMVHFNPKYIAPLKLTYYELGLKVYLARSISATSLPFSPT